MFHSKLNRISVSILLSVCLFVQGCTPSSNLIPLLDAVVAAAQAALPILAATGTIPAPVATTIGAYLNSVTQATTQTVAELSSPDPASVQATKIADYWASAVLDPSVVGNLPPQAANLVRAVQASVAAFVASIQAAKGGGVGVAKANAATFSTKPLVLSMSDHRTLGGIAARAKAVQEQISQPGKGPVSQ